MILLVAPYLVERYLEDCAAAGVHRVWIGGDIDRRRDRRGHARAPRGARAVRHRAARARAVRVRAAPVGARDVRCAGSSARAWPGCEHRCPCCSHHHPDPDRRSRARRCARAARPRPRGLVVFAEGATTQPPRSVAPPSSRSSCATAAWFRTLVLDLLAPDEEQQHETNRTLALEPEVLAGTASSTRRASLVAHGRDLDLPIGYLGGGTGAIAALIAAARQPRRIAAVVARGGDLDRAGEVPGQRARGDAAPGPRGRSGRRRARAARGEPHRGAAAHRDHRRWSARRRYARDGRRGGAPRGCVVRRPVHVSPASRARREIAHRLRGDRRDAKPRAIASASGQPGSSRRVDRPARPRRTRRLRAVADALGDRSRRSCPRAAAPRPHARPRASPRRAPGTARARRCAGQHAGLRDRPYVDLRAPPAVLQPRHQRRRGPRRTPPVARGSDPASRGRAHRARSLRARCHAWRRHARALTRADRSPRATGARPGRARCRARSGRASAGSPRGGAGGCRCRRARAPCSSARSRSCGRAGP